VGHTTLAAHYIPEEIERKRERENLTSVDGSAVLQRRKWREREQEKEGGGSSKTKRVNGGGGSSAVVRGRVFNREESVRACWNFVWVKFV